MRRSRSATVWSNGSRRRRRPNSWSRCSRRGSPRCIPASHRSCASSTRPEPATPRSPRWACVARFNAFTNYHHAARILRGRGGLRASLTVERAAATIWSLGHPNTYRLLVVDQGWSLTGYRAWLEDQLAAALLPTR